MNHDNNHDTPRQSPSAADLLGPQLTLATQEQGYTAALTGEHVSNCPWKGATTERDRALQTMWIRGYAAGRTDLRAARTRQC
jgi:ribosome modulation factor